MTGKDMEGNGRCLIKVLRSTTKTFEQNSQRPAQSKTRHVTDTSPKRCSRQLVPLLCTLPEELKVDTER
jgi:hypothetical protein